MSSAPIIAVHNLRKQFGKFEAVKGVSFSVKKGICFGILGPNGAGKTTTMEIMETVQSMSSGEIFFAGRALKPNDSAYKQSIGIQFQSTALQDFLTTREVLQFFSGLYPRCRSIEELVQRCALQEFLDRDHRKLSGGQRQRMLLAVAILHDPALIFLDEPTTGLDPQSRRNFWELIRSIIKDGKTVIMSTHYMEEAYELCDELLIMDHGEIIASGTPDALLRQHFHQSTIILNKEFVALDSLKGLPCVDEAESIVMLTESVNETIAELISRGISLKGLRVQPPNLEDLFIKLTGHGLRG